MRSWVSLGAALIAGLQAIFGAAMAAAAALGVGAGVGFGYAMCSGGSGCESEATLLAKGALLLALVASVLVVAPSAVAIGLVRNRRWAPRVGVVVELTFAAASGLWLALQQPTAGDLYWFGIPAVALVAAALMTGLLMRTSSKASVG